MQEVAIRNSGMGARGVLVVALLDAQMTGVWRGQPQVGCMIKVLGQSRVRMGSRKKQRDGVLVMEGSGSRTIRQGLTGFETGCGDPSGRVHYCIAG